MTLVTVFGLLFVYHSLSPSLGYRFACLEFRGKSCECDTDDELIDCNGRAWTEFPSLKSRLRGFSVMTLAFNDITGPLPSEMDVLKQLPDLKLLDLRGNDKLDCDEILSKFDRINVHSHCIEEVLAKESSTLAHPLPLPPLRSTPSTRPTPKVINRRKNTKRPAIPWPERPKVPFPYPELVPRSRSPCSLWCHLETGVSTAYTNVYTNVHRVWVKLKDQFDGHGNTLTKKLFSILN